MALTLDSTVGEAWDELMGSGLSADEALAVFQEEYGDTPIQDDLELSLGEFQDLIKSRQETVLDDPSLVPEPLPDVVSYEPAETEPEIVYGPQEQVPLVELNDIPPPLVEIPKPLEDPSFTMGLPTGPEGGFITDADKWDLVRQKNEDAYTEIHSRTLAKFWWDNIKDDPDGISSRKLEKVSMPRQNTFGFWGQQVEDALDFAMLAPGISVGKLNRIATGSKIQPGFALKSGSSGLDTPMTQPYYFAPELVGFIEDADDQGRYTGQSGETFGDFYSRFKNTDNFKNFQDKVREQVARKAKYLERGAQDTRATRAGTFFGGAAGLLLHANALVQDTRDTFRDMLVDIGAPESVATALFKPEQVLTDTAALAKDKIEESYGLSVDFDPKTEVGNRAAAIKEQFPLLPDNLVEDLALAGGEFGLSRVVEFAAQNAELQSERFKSVVPGSRRGEPQDVLAQGPGLKEYMMAGGPLRSAAGFGLNTAKDGLDFVLGFVELAKLAPGFTAANNQVRRNLEEKYGTIGDDPILNFYVGALSAAAEKGMLLDAPLGFFKNFADDPMMTYATQPLSTMLMLRPVFQTLGRSGNAYLRAKSMELEGVLTELDLAHKGMPLDKLSPKARQILQDAGINPENYADYVRTIEESMDATGQLSVLDYTLGDKPKTKAALSYILNKETLDAVVNPITSDAGRLGLAPDTPLVAGSVKLKSALAPVAVATLMDPVVSGAMATGTLGLNAAPLAGMIFPFFPKWVKKNGENGLQVNLGQSLVNQSADAAVGIFDDIGRVAGESPTSPESVFRRGLVENYYKATDGVEGIATFIKNQVALDANMRAAIEGEAAVAGTLTFGQLTQLIDQTVGQAADASPELVSARALLTETTRQVEELKSLTPDQFEALVGQSDSSPAQVLERAQLQLDAARLDYIEAGTQALYRAMGDSEAVMLPESWGPEAVRNQQLRDYERLRRRNEKQREELQSDYLEDVETINFKAGVAAEKVEAGIPKRAEKAFKESPEFKVWDSQYKAAKKKRGSTQGKLTRLQKKMEDAETKHAENLDNLSPEGQLEATKKFEEQRSKDQSKLLDLREQFRQEANKVDDLTDTRERLVDRYLNPDESVAKLEQQRLADQVARQEKLQRDLNDLSEEAAALDQNFTENLNAIGRAVANDRAAQMKMVWGSVSDSVLPQDTRATVGYRTDNVQLRPDGRFESVRKDRVTMTEGERQAQFAEADAALRARLFNDSSALQLQANLARLSARNVSEQGLGGFPLELVDLETGRKTQVKSGAGGTGEIVRLYTDLYQRVLADDTSQLLLRSDMLRERFVDYLQGLATENVTRAGLRRLVNDFASPRVEDASGVFYWTDTVFEKPLSLDPATVPEASLSGLEGRRMSDLYKDFWKTLPENFGINLKLFEIKFPGKVAESLGFVTKEGVRRQARIEAWERLTTESTVAAQSQSTFGYLMEHAGSMPNLMFDNGFASGLRGGGSGRYLANQVYDYSQNGNLQPTIIHGAPGDHIAAIKLMRLGRDASEQVGRTMEQPAAPTPVTGRNTRQTQYSEKLQELDRLRNETLPLARRAKDSDAIEQAQERIGALQAEIKSIERGRDLFNSYMRSMQVVWKQKGNPAGTFDFQKWAFDALDQYEQSFTGDAKGYTQSSRAPIRLKSDIGENASTRTSEGAGLARFKLPVQFEFMPGFADVWESMGVKPDDVYIREDATGSAAGSAMFWLMFNQAISQHGGPANWGRNAVGALKGWFTGLNPGSIATQWIANPLTEAIYTGGFIPAATTRVLKTAMSDYPSWAKNPDSVPPDVAFTFEQAVEANLLNLDFYTQEVLAGMRSLDSVPLMETSLEYVNAARIRGGLKPITDLGAYINRWRQRTERGLSRAFQSADQSHRLHRFKEAHVSMLKQERVLNVGEQAFYTDVRKGRLLGVAERTEDGWKVKVPGQKEAITGREAVLKMNELRRNAARDHANSLFVDFRDKVGIQHIFGLTGGVFTSNFPTWRYAALDIPFIKRGLLANSVSPRTFFSTTNAAAARQQIRTQMGRDFRRSLIGLVGLTGDPERDSLGDMTKDYQKSGALFLAGSEGRFINGASVIPYSGVFGLLRDLHEFNRALEASGMYGAEDEDLKAQRRAEKKLGITPPSYVIPFAREVGLGEGLMTSLLSDMTRANRIANEKGNISDYTVALIKNFTPQYAGRAMRAIGVMAQGATPRREGLIGDGVNWLLETVEPVADSLESYDKIVERSGEERVEVAAAVSMVIFNQRLGSLPLKKRLKVLENYSKPGAMSAAVRTVEKQVEQDFKIRTNIDGEMTPDQKEKLQREIDEAVAFEKKVHEYIAEKLKDVNIEEFMKYLTNRKRQSSSDWGD